MENIEINKENIKNLTPIIITIKKNKIFSNQVCKFYEFGFTQQLGESKFDKLIIFKWSEISSFRYNFKKRKNLIWFKTNLKFNMKNSWSPILIENKDKYKIIEILNENLIEDKNKYFILDNLTSRNLILIIIIIILLPKILRYSLS